MDIQQFMILDSDEVVYIPNFVTKEEESYLLRKIEETPEHRWKTLANRRLQVLGGEIASNVLMSQTLPDYITDYPHLLSRIRDTGVFQGSKHGQPNHVLLNEYLPGQGIMPHEDGPAYFPSVATLSLGSHTVVHYYRYERSPGDGEGTPSTAGRGAIDKAPILSIFLEPRSLVITRSKLYTHHLHGIDGITRDVIQPSRLDGRAQIANRNLVGAEPYKTIVSEGGEMERTKRISLTFRDVEKVIKARFR